MGFSRTKIPRRIPPVLGAGASSPAPFLYPDISLTTTTTTTPQSSIWATLKPYGFLSPEENQKSWEAT